jgi:hypothetical protein
MVPGARRFLRNDVSEPLRRPEHGPVLLGLHRNVKPLGVLHRR